MRDRNGGQSLIARLAEAVEGALQQHSSGWAGERAVQAVELGEQHDVFGGELARVGRRGGSVALHQASTVQVLRDQAAELRARIARHPPQTAADQAPVGFALQRILEPLEYTLDMAVASHRVGRWGEAEVDGAGQKPPQLLEGDELHIVHIDHHAVMIDPKTSFQAHTPLETRSSLQAHTPLEEAPHSQERSIVISFYGAPFVALMVFHATNSGRKRHARSQRPRDAVFLRG